MAGSREVGHRERLVAAGPTVGSRAAGLSARPIPEVVAHVDPSRAEVPYRAGGPSSLAEEGHVGPILEAVAPCRAGALPDQGPRASGSPRSRRVSSRSPCARPTCGWPGRRTRSLRIPRGRTEPRSACSGPTSLHGSPHSARIAPAPSPCSRPVASHPRKLCGNQAAGQTQERLCPSRVDKRRLACPLQSPCE